MRTEERQQEDRVRRTQPLNIIQAKVENSLFSLAIGQISVNLTLTIHRSGCREATERVWMTPAGWAGRLTAMLSVLAALALVQPLHSSAAEAAYSLGVPTGFAASIVVCSHGE